MSGILLEHFHGAVTRVGADGHGRPAPGAGLQPPHPVGVDRSRRRPTPTSRGRERRTTRSSRTAASGRWLNYFGDDEDAGALDAAYGPNHARLGEVKRRYDPDNVFHLNQNILPV